MSAPIISATTLGPKYPSERVTLELDFSDRLNDREITQASVSVSVAIGTDPAPDDIKDGPPGYVLAPIITVPIKAGLAGVTYWIHTRLDLADGDIIIGSVKLAVVAQK